MEHEFERGFDMNVSSASNVANISIGLYKPANCDKKIVT
jgi:hypothetical protein